LTHINNLKADRIKTGSDLLIQSARGFVYDEEKHSWVKKFDPCNVIVFEDLSRYKPDTGRTKHKNSKLMEWAHREILAQIKGQAQLYGISIYDSTDARYTSKFYAKTNAPGIRCKSLKNEDFEGELFSMLKNDDYTEEEIDRLKEGDIVPKEGGELFATLNNDKLKIVHADINASWNLQRRFWGRHTDLLNFKTHLSGGQLTVKDDAKEKRLGFNSPTQTKQSEEMTDEDDAKEKRSRFDGALEANGFNPKNAGLTRVQGSGYKITSDKNNTVAWSSDDGKYSPNLFRDVSREFYQNKDEFYPKGDFEKNVREKIIAKLKGGV
jgi:IS605 OrfB family transposase